MESNAKAYSTVRLILFLNISLSKRVTFAQVSEGKRLIGSEAPTPLLNFFAEDLPQSWTLALSIEIGFKRAVVVVYQGKGIFLNIEANNADAVLAFAPSAAVCLLQTDTKSKP